MIKMSRNISVTTDFVSGGGNVVVRKSVPVTIRLIPHNEGKGGWSQVWFYFLVEGITPGEIIVLELDRGIPKSSGISPQIFFSYDQEVWGLTDVGTSVVKENRDFFKYEHIASGSKIWFAYDLPYTPNHLEKLLVPLIQRNANAGVFTLCKTRNNHDNLGIHMGPYKDGPDIKYGIWLQARDHAFESGSSWVIHEMAKWLMSEHPEAVALRNCSDIFIVPIVDTDGVVEGRTGKYREPYDHWMNWGYESSYWPEVNAIKSKIRNLADENRMDLFIDFHGPGGESHPYFTIPFENLLPYDLQKKNRLNFFQILNAKVFDEEARRTQSMTQFHYSERPWDNHILGSSHEWVTIKANKHSVALTIEVNMNTPLSTQEGYRSEAIVLGRAISKYFTDGYLIR